jgi:hypothetical protein
MEGLRNWTKEEGPRKLRLQCLIQLRGNRREARESVRKVMGIGKVNVRREQSQQEQ